MDPLASLSGWRKWLFLFLLAAISFGCGKKKEKEGIRVTLLRGPSAIAFAQWMAEEVDIDGKPLRLEVVDSPAQVQALLVKGETEIAILPMSTAANLYNKGIPYHVAGCPIWGTLYLVGRRDSSKEKRSLLLFGAGTTPDILACHYLRQQEGYHFQPNYAFHTPGEVLQALLTTHADAALLSEPFLGIALKRDTTLHILADLNRQGESPEEGFAQTALFISSSLQANLTEIDSLASLACRFANQEPTRAIRILEEKGVFAPGMLDSSMVRRCRIDYRNSREAAAAIHAFLQVIYQDEPRALGGQLPDDRFLTSAL